MKKIVLIGLAMFTPILMAKDLLKSINVLDRTVLPMTESAALTAQVNAHLFLDGSTEFGIHLPGGGYESLVLDDLKVRSNNNFTWVGRFKGHPESSVSFAYVNGYISGVAFNDRETFEFMPQAKDQIRIASLLTDAFAECEVDEVSDTALPVSNQKIPTTPSGSTDTLDVMVIYTPQARDAAGGVSGIEATAQAAVDAMNLSFDNSNVDAEAKISYVGLANYNDSGSSSESLTWVRSDPTVAQLRTAYGADMVSLLSNDIGGSCGRGYVMQSPGAGFESFAYQVTSRSCAVGNLSFAHEFGHNMGLEHNPENSSTDPMNASNPWSFGHYHNNEYRTVMSYSAQCANGCSRRQYFSNPDVQYLGLDTGIADTRDNARTLRQTAGIVAAFRPEANDTIFEDGYEG
ncbi:M12 family metallo-peptidase [Marinicella rhabdoformis]|uniref:M12 family metallo-peptidase n=1 Tax=Marinicella rhabdoformis TaxID=2580566 RepID=UPI0012AED230|nr:M12 family metallo-peptidase [Marinicella rhabdoformis]